MLINIKVLQLWHFNIYEPDKFRAQLSTEFQLLIKTKIPTHKEVSYFKLSHAVFIMLINVKMPTIVGVLTFMSRINFVFS